MTDPHDPPVHTVSFRFYAELNDFLPPGRWRREFAYQFAGTPSVKDAIEALGVPHPEIDLIVVNGASVGFDHHLHDGDRISVYPVFEALDISPVVHLRAQPLRVTQFVLDAHLGKLARALRLLGFDAAWDRARGGSALIAQSLSQHRIILTRNRDLLKSNDVTHGYWIRSSDPEEQLRDVIERFDLRAQAHPFARCSVCNGTIEPTDTETARREVPKLVAERYDEFHRCTSCGKLYWKGTHYERLESFISGMMGDEGHS